jgi:uncharacterized repeat protein (TIGR01451 family)
MNPSRAIRVCTFAVAFLGSLQAAAVGAAVDLCQGLVQDKLAHPMTALSKPALGQAVTDPQFGTRIRRITAVTASGSNPVIKPLYSTVSAWNADESKLLLYKVGAGHQLYDGKTYAFIKTLPISPADLEQVYWHTSDPDLLFYVEGTRLIRYHVSSGVKDVVRTFEFCSSGASAGPDSMFMSWDSNRIGLTCSGQDFIYTLSTNTVSPRKSARDLAPQVAPTGTLALWRGDVVDANMTVLRSLPIDPYEHASLGKLATGHDTYNGLQFEGTLVGSLVTYDMTNGSGRVVIGPSSGYPYPPTGTHVSGVAYKQPGWVFLSVVGSVSGQTVLSQEIVVADTNSTGKVCRIAHHRSYGKNNTQLADAYWAEPHVVPSPSGTRAIFASDWGNGSTVDTYVVELPSYLGGSTAGVDLTVSQTDSPDPVLLGNDVTYTVTVRNQGTAAASGVRLLETLPSRLTFISAIPASGTCGYSSGAITCSVGNLAAGASTTVAIVGSPTAAGSFTAQASVSANESDTNSANNTASQTTTAQPGLSIGDVSVTEGNSGTVSAVFTATLSAASAQTVTVSWATANGTATAGSDYVAASGTLSFAAGTISKTLSVAVTADTTAESNETFFVNLTGASGAVLTDSQGRGTILNDDATTTIPSLSIQDARLAEGNSGSQTTVFSVVLSAPSTQTVSVHYATANGSATAGSDYLSTSGTLSFAPGTTSRTIGVTVVGDTAIEANEVFYVNLSAAVNATIARAQGTAAIVNDDSTGPAKAQIISPAPGSTLPGTTVGFSWTAGTSVSSYGLTVGTSYGAYDIFNLKLSGLSTTVTGLPTGGRTLYVRLLSLINGTWTYMDYTYKAAP